MKKEGIDVPNTMHSYNNTSREEIEFKLDFIKEKTNLGWTRQKIAENLGLKDGASISRFIRMYIDE